MNSKVIAFEDDLAELVYNKLEGVTPEEVIEYYGEAGRIIADILKQE